MSKPKKEKFSMKEAWALNWRGFKDIYKLIPGAVLSNCCWVILEALTPYAGIWLSAQIIGELAGARNPERLTQLVIITLSVTIFLTLLTAAAGHWKNAHSATSWHSILSLYGDKMMSMDFSAADDPKTHDLLSQIQQNANWSGHGLHSVQYDQFLKAIFQIGGGIALTVSLFVQKVPEGPLTFLNHPLTVIALLVIMMVFILVAPLCSTKSESYWSKGGEEVKLGNRMFSFFGFLGMDSDRTLDVRLYDQLAICRRHMGNSRTGSNDFLAKFARGPMGAFAAAGAAISSGFVGVAYVFVCLKAWAGAFGVGAVTQYVGAITNFSAGVTLLISTMGRIYNNTPFIRTCYEFLDLPNEMYQGSLTTEKRSDRQYEIEFRDVSFKYPASETWALRHVSMKFKIGSRLAVVGQNGSGKTTFIKLLCRLYDPTEGEILLNGIDIRKYNYAEYLSVFSVVFQDFQLLSFPLGQNVAAREKYDRVLAEQCLRQAGFGDRLDTMPKGLDSSLGRDFDPNGVDVSGGEAQKIAIARSLYKDAPFIILDEPTAALDPVAEQEVYERFNEIASDKTTIYISHRLSSCRFCDEIAVFDQGNVIQQGTHDWLLSDETGKYAELWNAQAQYYR
ncbi:MAG: ABC transporter ATP-binding protein [Oscillospiraceae bacterium]|jgi:ATP-binding cassette subfamily B protein|nr:ABC transporter ATP-binding protein [Oscillospiraceae bacterium]